MAKSRTASAAWQACRDNLSHRTEVASVSAFVVGPTRDGHLARLALTAIYTHRGHGARRIIGQEYARDFYKWVGIDTKGVGRDDNPADDGDQPRHTWWPRHAHLCAMLSSVCREAAFDALCNFDADALVAPDAAEVVADAVGGHVRTYISAWGALSMAALARAWPVIDNDNEFAATLRWRARVPTMSVADASNLPASIDGVPDADDSEGLRDFADLTSVRDAALKSTVVAGVEPYSYDGVRIMSRSLRRFEDVAVYHERPALLSGLKAMRHQLYGSPHRL
ncbi:hypothetical protein psal_cds_1238 [Pandoravirus salinus]|uniref:Uncharacterized protein n=1 Tax=Pandoravirus salinus TaxID=1349410 RepID=S4W4D0_9VIRU|nr:hypothetical protein psal_cds_1238 [Pandoravirus salinus]AGO85562.1 hypothetical protein psal_cds_1238 [Pandoravirus salinus]